MLTEETACEIGATFTLQQFRGEVMNALRIVLPLGVAAIIAALIVGNQSPPLDVYRGVNCGSAWGGIPNNTDVNVETACAPIRAERFAWATTLMVLGVGLLLSSAALSRGAKNPQATQLWPAATRALPPAPKPAPEPPRQSRTPTQPSPSPASTSRIRQRPRTTTSSFRQGDSAKVVSPGDHHDGQIGRIYEQLGADDDFTVCIKFSGDSEVYAFEPDELEAIASPGHNPASKPAPKPKA
jgi:hypothetical protein